MLGINEYRYRISVREPAALIGVSRAFAQDL